MIDELGARVAGYLRGTAEQLREAAGYPQPRFRLTLGTEDLTAAVVPRLISLTLTDNRGLEADQLDLDLSDHDGLLEIPPKGARLSLALGWSDTGLVDKGTYTVDEVEHSGSPDRLVIRARSADMRGGLKARRTRSWPQAALGDVIRAIAAEHGLGPLVGLVLDKVLLSHVDQANESDANLLTRLGEQFDAIASVKAGRLLFLPAGKATSASGLQLPHITLTRADGDQHRYLEADRDSYSGVRAYYYDADSAKKKAVIAGGGDNLKDLRHTYADIKSALPAARAEWNRLQRGGATLTYTLARGRPDLIPELTYSLVGVKPQIDAIVWLGARVVHQLGDDGYTTALELETKLPDADEVAELFEETEASREYTGFVAWYRNAKTGQQHRVTAGDQTRPKRLPRLYVSEKNARRAVEREWRRMQPVDG